MEVPQFDTAQVHRQGYGPVSFGADDRLITWFFDKAMLHGAKSKEAGRPIYENVPHVHIQHPGERDFIECPATHEHTQRFPKKWAAYQSRQEQKIDGTLLAVLFPDNPAIVENMRHASILTVEQLAQLNDTQIQGIGLGGREFVTRAKNFLEHASKGKEFNALADKIAALERDRIADRQKIAALEAAVEETNEPRRGPGRPRKAVAA